MRCRMVAALTLRMCAAAAKLPARAAQTNTAIADLITEGSDLAIRASDLKLSDLMAPTARPDRYGRTAASRRPRRLLLFTHAGLMDGKCGRQA
jgi:hypothetical protein